MGRRTELRHRQSMMVFDAFQQNEQVLYLYSSDFNSSDLNRRNFFTAFVSSGIKNGEYCAFAGTERNWKHLFPDPEFLQAHRDHTFRIFRIHPDSLDDRKKLAGFIEEVYSAAAMESFSSVRVLIDLGEGFKTLSLKERLDFERELLERIMLKDTPTSLTLAYNIENMESGMAKELMERYPKVIMSTEQGFNAFTSTRREPTAPSFNLISQETLEKGVKDSLETIVLALLRQHPLCGYDIIQGLNHQFRVMLSAGTIYPLLHSLEGRGIVQSRMVSNRKLYFPTEEGAKIIDSQLEEFVRTQEYLIDLIANPK